VISWLWLIPAVVIGFLIRAALDIEIEVGGDLPVEYDERWP
jgi:hypothetical protein